MNVLVVGLAKTGTTVVSEAIAKTIGARRYVSEPKSPRELDTTGLAAENGGVVVKLLFEHWHKQPNLRRGLARNETELQFDRRVFMLRDPRDELLSRLHFMIKPLLDAGTIEADVLRRWVDVFRRKEAAPAALPVFEMVRECQRLLGGAGLDDLANAKRYYRFAFKEIEERHLLKYEDFVGGGMAGLEAYIGCGAIAPPVATRFEHRKRTAAHDNWKSYFTPADVTHYQRTFGATMDELGYTDWELVPRAQLDAATGSDYVEKLIKMSLDRRNGKWSLAGLQRLGRRARS